MNDIIANNIKHLRKIKGITQEELARALSLSRSVIGSYEENRAIPKLNVMQDIANYFSISIDQLVNFPLWKEDKNITSNINTDKLRILTTVVDKENKELITSVPVQASAGYTKAYSDPDYIEKLPHFSLPLAELSKEKTYRLFQIKGDSMLPIPSGSYIICEYLVNWQDLVDGKTYILITKDEGIVYKRIYNKVKESGELLLKSDNTEYTPYTINISEIMEIWKALGFISFNFPEPEQMDMNNLFKMVVDLKNEVSALKNKSSNE